MATKNNRIFLFLFGCITVRILFVIGAYKASSDILPYLGLVGLLISMGFLYSYIKNKKVGAFGGNVWWHQLRIVHSLIYLLFAIYAFQKKDFAYLVLLFDVLLGLVSFCVK